MNEKTRAIINRVFEQTGVKIAEDDPIVGLLICIEDLHIRNLEAFKEHENSFFLQLDQRFDSVKKIYDALEERKHSIQLELITHCQRIAGEKIDQRIKEVEEKTNKDNIFLKKIIFIQSGMFFAFLIGWILISH